MEKLIKVKINHTGNCMGYSYVQNEEIELPENVVKALGKDATVIKEVEHAKIEEKVEEKEVRKPFFDKMIGKEDTKTK